MILRALKKYGMILADNGSSWFICGVPDSRWDNDHLVNELKLVTGSNFEAVDESSLIVNPDSGQVSTTPTPDSISPTVSITLPANGATVSGSAVQVSANASDNVGVVGVRFKLDGVNLGSIITVPPYTVSWNTASAANGSHALTALAQDAAGNTTTSSAVAVTVSNSGSNSGGGGSGGGCFIATAAYGSPLDSRVLLLRAFRDEYLASNRIGRLFSRWYSRVSPPLAEKVRESPFLSCLARGILWPPVIVVWLIFHPWAGIGLLLGGSLCWFIGRKRTKETIS